MSTLLAALLKGLLTEKLLKNILGIVGDYLVKSSKNKLDDALWAQVKKALGVGK